MSDRERTGRYAASLAASGRIRLRMASITTVAQSTIRRTSPRLESRGKRVATSDPFPIIVNGQPLLARSGEFSGRYPAELEWEGPRIALETMIDIASGKFAVRGRIVEAPGSAEGHHRAEVVGPLMTDRMACLVVEKKSDDSWETYLATFTKRSKFELLWMNPALLPEPEDDWEKRIVTPPDGQVRESGVTQSHSEDEAVQVAFSALDNLNSTIHDRGILPRRTRVYVSKGGPLVEVLPAADGVAAE